ncbi:MAG: discoidin domain-containing protein [Phycisphaerales bacterium JB063]
MKTKLFDWRPLAVACLALLTGWGCSTTSARDNGGSRGGALASVAASPTVGSRHWLGPGYWGNRLHDWRFEDGRIECVCPQGWLGVRTVHDLTRQMEDAGRPMRVSARVTLTTAGPGVAGDGGGGFLVGVGRGEMDYRAAALVHEWQAYGGGLFAGINSAGECFIVDNESAWSLGGSAGAAGLSAPAGALPRDGWRVAADSEESDGPAEQAIDGDPNTLWHTQYREQRDPHPHAIVIDMGEQVTFDGIAYLPRQDSNSGRVGQYRVKVSPDAQRWSEAVASGTFPDSDLLRRVSFEEVTARYVMLEALSAQRIQPATSVAELWVTHGRGDGDAAGAGPDAAEAASSYSGVVDLVVEAEPAGNGRTAVTVTATDPATGQVVSAAAKVVDASRLLGNVALVSHPGTRGPEVEPALYAFEDWTITGEGVAHHPDQTFGPIACAQHTLSRGVLKLTAQFLPLDDDAPRSVQLQVRQDGRWATLATAELDTRSWTANFRIAGWDDSADHDYRVRYAMPVAAGETYAYTWSGTIRRDPADEAELTVAAFTGNINMPWSNRRNWKDITFFPHGDLVERVVQHDPDVLFFSGDQVYEGGSPSFADRAHIEVDYLYKWLLWCWAYRDITADIPTVTIPDDHDVYQGNIWGEGGRQAPGADNTGGYVWPASFVNVVHRTQTSHLPDPYDPTPIGQDISVYYTDMIYGRVSFAVLADRMFKSGCAGHGLPPSGTGRPDHYNNEQFDTADLDLPGLVLLGDRQLAFLNHWAGDWEGADMKVCLSQTIFANMATHHGGGMSYIIADLDSNGWPQTGRNNALRELRRAFALHIAGDQHLGSLVHHGIDAHEDAVWSLCVPSVANAYPRAWAPETREPYAIPSNEEFMGHRTDGFKNLVTVYAASNPGRDMGTAWPLLHDNMPGYGIVVINKDDRSYDVQCWPRSADPTDPSQQYEGWPRVIEQSDNYAKEPAGYLPWIVATGTDDPIEDPVIHVINENTGELVYALRIKGNRYRPAVFEPGSYTVIVTEQDTGKRTTARGLMVTDDADATIHFIFAPEEIGPVVPGP